MKYKTAVDWANAYKDLINEHKVRKDIIKCNDNYGDATYGVRKRNMSNRGTIYHAYRDARGKLTGTAHFMAFAGVDQGILIYDPAGGNSQFRVSASDMPEHLDMLSKTFGVNITVENLVTEDNLQVIRGDTWCQTWSFAWIDNTMRGWLKQPKTNKALIIKILKEILKRLEKNGWEGAKQLRSDFLKFYQQPKHFAKFY